LSFFISCKNNPNPDQDLSSGTNTWKNLIITDSFEGWHIYQNYGTKQGWSVDGEILTFTTEMTKGNGDKSLVSDKKYTNFEIQFDWMVSEGGNSGFLWGVNEDARFQFPYETGAEIQVLDPEVYKGNESAQKNTAGALYDMLPPTSLVTKPAGEWNSYYITINHNINEGIVIHNGIEVNRFPLHGPEWDKMVGRSKFSEKGGKNYWEEFGSFKTGHIVFQDHPGTISFRNIKIKEL
jgi:hypothetical protein